MLIFGGLSVIFYQDDMLKLNATLRISTENANNDFDFWPAQAIELLEQKEFLKVIEICEQNLTEDSGLISVKLIYARALIGAGRLADATEQLYQILAADPDHIAALKFLGDILYEQNDQVSAMANYNRVLEIDPECGGLKSEFVPKPIEPAPAITIVKGPETIETSASTESRNPFRTETVADLYLKQGQPRLAIEILKELMNGSQDSRLNEKLAAAEKVIAQKERRDVEQQN